ncbi:hypothetical protein C1Y18_19580 [Pseudomonas sp. MPR-R5A]|jgi:hypothetical protein|uniref:Uncharacterized protein n=1 Tax=Pseudomonas gorinensis TaxID=3240790 RepID=A0ACA7P2L3_9PSED|nr:hypothetical protein U771_07905 [Pseudomonas sp. TKP]PMX13232.1 hypothetical protein C1Y25_19240 [Pseudomonas sp. MPBC4-3]PMX21112.1 hypothetical protein C1Y23_22150 [Pseudomonas sp. GW460-12]PMX31157.1 hypothetical protein C1Y24_26045 [Pseudomonas sp. MPR-R2A4]PMX38487.1 hypothetical protein C1Y26_22550 [Pseudomonas sp. MPR-R2A7]PMX45343.1 hypothetical protein C1Y20_21205 [Pseudomonas sp. FW301-21B01]PMX52697.1 hypothetical protein C1Y17_17670 [Pseudomonas sp. MPR-R2A6]PMX86380.1 hypothe
MTPILWHFAITYLKNADKRPINQSPARISLKKLGLNPTTPDKDALQSRELSFIDGYLIFFSRPSRYMAPNDF